jgi:hypothetical protein
MLQIVWLSAGLFDRGNSAINFWSIFAGFKNNTVYGYIYCFAYGFVPLFGGLFGINIAKKWGMFTSSMGKALFFLSISLVVWSIGAYTWAYYNFVVHASVPYPGLSDVAWVSSIPLWAIGVFFLGQATFIKFALRKAGGKLFAVLVPLLVLASSWYFLVVVARGGSVTSGGGVLKVFFDIAYPTGDAIILTLAFLIYGLSFLYLGGKYKWPIIIILLGFVLEYIADFSFSYTTTVNTYYNGDWVDFLYATALFTIGLGVTLLDRDAFNKEVANGG